MWDNTTNVSTFVLLFKKISRTSFPSLYTGKLNFIDCPGSDDFIGGAVSALNVTDTALMVLNAQYGVEVGTINQFRYTEQFHKPVIFVVNQLDNDKADYDGTIAQLREQW